MVVEIYKLGKKVRLQDAFWISKISRYNDEKEMPDAESACESGDKHKNHKSHKAKFYIARTTVDGEVVFGQFYASNNTVYVPFAQKGHFLLVSELLVARPKSLAWVSCGDILAFENAVIGGYSENSQPVFIGRAKFENVWIPGKITIIENRPCFISWGNQEFANYEILVGASSSLILSPGAKWADVNLVQSINL